MDVANAIREAKLVEGFGPFAIRCVMTTTGCDDEVRLGPNPGGRLGVERNESNEEGK